MNHNNKKRKNWKQLNWVNAFGILLINVSAFMKKMTPFKTSGEEHFQILLIKRNYFKTHVICIFKPSPQGDGCELWIIPINFNARDQVLKMQSQP